MWHHYLLVMIQVQGGMCLILPLWVVVWSWIYLVMIILTMTGLHWKDLQLPRVSWAVGQQHTSIPTTGKQSDWSAMPSLLLLFQLLHFLPWLVLCCTIRYVNGSLKNVLSWLCFKCQKVNCHIPVIREECLHLVYLKEKIIYCRCIPQFPIQFQSSVFHLGNQRLYLNILFIAYLLPVVCSKAAVAADTKVSCMFGAARRNDTVVLWDGVPHDPCPHCSFPGEGIYS